MADTDRELLELAAKAAGYDLLPHSERDGKFACVTDDGWQEWNPLTDDGDALRLAVTIGLSIITEPFYVRIHGANDTFLVREEVICDGYAATRRAIVRAAAEIGRQRG